MAVVVGGSKMNLIESYLAGEDTNIDYGKARWLAQTFTLDVETVVWRFRLKSYTPMTPRLPMLEAKLGAPMTVVVHGHTSQAPT